MNRNMSLAFCGMTTALSTVLVFLTGIIPFGRTAFLALAGVLLIVVVSELGAKWAWSVYLAVSILSALLAANKNMVLGYVLLFGLYSILKALIEKKTKKITAFLLKLVFFNAATVLESYLAVALLHLSPESYKVFGVSLPWLFMIWWNLGFLVYDYALSLLVISYFKKIHPFVKKWLSIR